MHMNVKMCVQVVYVYVSQVYSCTLIYEYGGVEVQCVSNLISQ